MNCEHIVVQIVRNVMPIKTTGRDTCNGFKQEAFRIRVDNHYAVLNAHSVYGIVCVDSRHVVAGIDDRRILQSNVLRRLKINMVAAGISPQNSGHDLFQLYVEVNSFTRCKHLQHLKLIEGTKPRCCAPSISYPCIRHTASNENSDRQTDQRLC